MTVNLSALGGAGQQFFDNNGDPLTGGKLYSYEAGTTTPQVTYTTVAGNVPHSNPIILDAAGRVATGEIWVTASQNYKFVLKTSTEVTLATWDNITGINGTGIATNALYVQYDPAGAGAVATNVQAKLRESISVTDFGAVGDGVADDTTAIQAAIDAAISAKLDLYLPGGTYKITSTLNVASTTIKIFGSGRYATIINSYSANSAIKFFAWNGVIDNLGIIIYTLTGNGIEAGNNSRNCAISNVYIQADSVYDPLNTGAGIYLNAESGFSGGIEIRTTYCLGFKYGLKMVGTDLSTDTWTTVSIYNFWALGSALTPGSIGIYMDALTNGIGTVMYGGTIEGFSIGIKVEDGSFGGMFTTDMEGILNKYEFGNTFCGSFTSAFGVPNYRRSGNGPSIIFEQYQIDINAVPKQENLYAPSWLVYTGGGTTQPINFYRNNVSVINGGALEANALKFGFGTGLAGSLGSSVHPSQHYVQVSNSKLHWGNDIPSARTGNQLVAWVRGDVCYNLSATVGQPIGWMCTVSGTPGTWVAMANL